MKHSGKIILAALVVATTGGALAHVYLRYRHPVVRGHPGQGRQAGWLLTDSFDGQKAYEEVRRFLEIAPRDAGTDGARKAADYLSARLQEFGLKPFVHEFMRPTPIGERTFRNVLVTIPGSATGLVVVASHYDTKPGISADFAGANDSGSSTGILLELARNMAGWINTGPEFMLAFLDGEECVGRYGPTDGLHGSRQLAQELANRKGIRVKAFILLDMVGDRNLHVKLPANSTPFLVSLLFDVAREQEVRSFFSLNNKVVVDDHVPFMEAGIPSIDIIDFEYGSAPGLNDYWHAKEDTLDKLSPESLQLVGRVVTGMLSRMAVK